MNWIYPRLVIIDVLKNSEETVVCMGLIVDKIMSVFDIFSEELYLD